MYVFMVLQVTTDRMRIGSPIIDMAHQLCRVRLQASTGVLLYEAASVRVGCSPSPLFVDFCLPLSLRLYILCWPLSFLLLSDRQTTSLLKLIWFHWPIRRPTTIMSLVSCLLLALLCLSCLFVCLLCYVALFVCLHPILVLFSPTLLLPFSLLFSLLLPSLPFFSCLFSCLLIPSHPRSPQ
ncbi:MAG: hypothetical protein JOS17DRAFT_373108 [Linnemannia elongata]|nr:MAG: hypothetical protein JOS17DRAFT_373108 [Linnemannia elongata]